MLLLLLAGCAGNIHELYEAERAAVFAEPAAVPENWQPEVRFRLHEDALDQVAQGAIAAGLLAFDDPIKVDNPLGGKIVLRPDATVNKLQLAVGQDCGACLDLTARLVGDLSWKVGPLKGTSPFKAKLGGTLKLFVTEQDTGHQLTAKVGKIDRVEIQMDRLGSFDASELLGDWTKKAVRKAPEIPLGVIGGEALPLRAVRLKASAQSIELQALTMVNGGSPVTAAAEAPDGDWDLRIHQDTVAALIRRTAFEAGTVSHDVAVDPRDLKLDDDGFTLGLRLWRLKGAGWWRDYEVQGTVSLKGRKMQLHAQEATEGDKSKGAGLADPIALLAEGRILAAVAEGVNTAVPVGRTVRTDTLKLKAKPEHARGQADTLVLSGSVSATPVSAEAGGGKSNRDGSATRPKRR